MKKLLKRLFALYLLIPVLPLVALAQSGTVQTMLAGINTLINSFIIPLLLSVAVLAFIYNTFQYFIVKSVEEEGRKKAKQYMLYSLAAFVIIVALWGIVNFIIQGLGFVDRSGAVCPDYIDPSECMDIGDFEGTTGPEPIF